MKRKILSYALSVLIFCCISQTAMAAYIFHDYAPTEYLGGTAGDLATMRQNLGIDGLAIEDFSGLTYSTGALSFSGLGVGSIVLENGNSWGEIGTGFLNFHTDSTSPATIEISGGTNIIGIGFNAFESSTNGVLTSISINGGSPIPFDSITLPSFTFSSIIRNGYLVIESDSIDPLIQRVDFIQIGSLDSYFLDYIAYNPNIAPVPEPATMLLFCVGLLGLAGISRNKQK